MDDSARALLLWDELTPQDREWIKSELALGIQLITEANDLAGGLAQINATLTPLGLCVQDAEALYCLKFEQGSLLPIERYRGADLRRQARASVL